MLLRHRKCGCSSEENAGGTAQSLPAFSVMAYGLAAGGTAAGLRAATETALATGLRRRARLGRRTRLGAGLRGVRLAIGAGATAIAGALLTAGDRAGGLITHRGGLTGVVGTGHLAGGNGGGFLRGAVGIFEAAALGGHAAVDGAVAGAGGATSGKLGPYRRNVVGSGRISGTLAAQVVPEELEELEEPDELDEPEESLLDESVGS